MVRIAAPIAWAESGTLVSRSGAALLGSTASLRSEVELDRASTAPACSSTPQLALT